MSILRLINGIKRVQCPVVAGLDPLVEYLPETMVRGQSPKDKADSIFDFNKALIDALCDIVPAVKPQAAYYEMLGFEGVRVLFETISYAQSKGMYVITDGKRNDIGSTAEAYSKAYLENSDSLTINAYLGFDGVKPFLKPDRSVFALVKTSNPSSGELQDLKLENGKFVYEHMGDMVSEWGRASINLHGYSDVGAVVGATYPRQLSDLRQRLPHTFFLVPGYGAQGAAAKDIAGGFDKNKIGSIINSSRAIMCAYKTQKLPANKFAEAARTEALRMRDEINSVL